MSTHRSRPKSRIPNWLKAWYASLAFMAFVIALSLLLERK